MVGEAVRVCGHFYFLISNCGAFRLGDSDDSPLSRDKLCNQVNARATIASVDKIMPDMCATCELMKTMPPGSVNRRHEHTRGG